MGNIRWDDPENMTSEEIVTRARWLLSVYDQLTDPVRREKLLKGMPISDVDLHAFKVVNSRWFEHADQVARARAPSFSIKGLPPFTDEEFEEINRGPKKTIDEIFGDRVYLAMFKVNLELRKARVTAYPQTYTNLNVPLTINSLTEMNELIERCVARLQKYDEDEGPLPMLSELTKPT